VNVRSYSIATAAIVSSLSGCPRSGPQTSYSAPAEATVRASRADVAEVLYDGGLQNGWQDWGWSPKELVPKGPAKVRFDQYGGWMLAKPGLQGDFGGVLLRVMEPAGEGEFLEVHLIASTGAKMPNVNVGPDDRVALGDGWTEVFVSMDRLNPTHAAFDHVVVQAFRPFGADPVPVDKIALTKSVTRSVAQAGAAVAASMSIDCRARATRISPLIYGAVPDKDGLSQLHATAARWGGNLSSTYNFELSAWNAGSDWFFENREAPSVAQFLKDNAAHGMRSALTIPMMGWVAKDKTSFSYPVSALGPQEKTDPYRPDVGNGKDRSGKPLSTSQERAYVPMTAAYVKRWIEGIRKEDAKTGKRSVDMYILDNEPMLWPTTHRDAHPEPTSYDELLARTIEYGTAIREADPDAVIAGPAEWGWTGYLYSAKDMTSGGTAVRPDRRAHGDMPVVAYYLKALAEHEKKTGIRLLDVFDLHGYPYADGVYSDAPPLGPELYGRVLGE
jgi:Glycoside hydrolase family 44